MPKKLNVGARRAQNVAREARKAANPNSQRAAVRAGTMTKAEAIEQATIRRAGVQAAGRRAAAGRAVERGVQERAARVETRRKEERAARNRAQRPAPPQSSGPMGKIKGVAKGAGVAIGGNIVAGAISGDGESRARNITSTMLGDAATGYAIGRQYGAAIGATVGLIRGTAQENQRTGKATINIPTTYTPGGAAWYIGSGAKAAAPKKTTAVPAGGSVGPKTGVAARRASAATPAAQKPTTVKPAAVKPAAQRKPKAASKASNYGETGNTAIKRNRAGLPPIQRMKPEMTVQDIQQTISPMNNTGLKSRKKDIQIGGIAGRTGGKWHLGKKVGKG